MGYGPFFPPEFRIRVAGPDEDWEALTGLLHRAYAELARQGFRYWASHQDAELTRKRARSGDCLLLTEEGAVVATVTLVPAGRPDDPHAHPWYVRPDVAHFHQFGVEPDLQGRGLGSLLLDATEERARRAGAAEIACDTAKGATRLIRYYERRGYRAVGRADWEGTNYESIILAKSLSPECRP